MGKKKVKQEKSPKQTKGVKLNDYLKGFGNHIGAAIEHIQLAANIYAEALNKYGDDAQRAFESAYPHVTPNTWDKLRAVGNGDANASIMLFSDKFAKKIMRMPKHAQDEVLNGQSFVVFNPTTRKAENIDYSNIRPRHERILFDEEKAHIRSIQEQVAYANVVAAESKRHPRPYTVYSDRIHVHHECDIGRSELKSALEEME